MQPSLSLVRSCCYSLCHSSCLVCIWRCTALQRRCSLPVISYFSTILLCSRCFWVATFGQWKCSPQPIKERRLWDWNSLKLAMAGYCCLLSSPHLSSPLWNGNIHGQLLTAQTGSSSVISGVHLKYIFLWIIVVLWTPVGSTEVCRCVGVFLCHCFVHANDAPSVPSSSIW